MQKITFLIVMLLSAIVFSQTPNWTNLKETNINVSAALSVDIFTNRDGNHIIVQESNNLKYYKMNLNGVAGSPITIESSGVVSPSISGDADNIYIAYGIGSQMRIRRSTNGGESFSLLLPTFSLSTPASWMESEVSNHILHVTYVESGIVKYRYRNQQGSWFGPFTVSEGETGTLPRIAASYGGSGKDSVYFV